MPPEVATSRGLDDWSGVAVANGISKRLRFEVLRRDNHTCRYCGALATETKLVVDHVIPVSLGGSTDPSNLAAACEDCNIGKTSTNPDTAVIADVSEAAQEWVQALQKAAEQQRVRYAVVRRAEVTHRAEAEQQVRECCDCVRGQWPDEQLIQTLEAMAEEHKGEPWAANCATTWSRDDFLPEGWTVTIKRFVQRGLRTVDIDQACREALTRPKVTDRWRYFCGICWNMIRQREEAAAVALHGSSVRPGDVIASVQSSSPAPLPLPPVGSGRVRSSVRARAMSPRVAKICQVCENDVCRSLVEPCPYLGS